MRCWILAVKLDSNDRIVSIERFAPAMTLKRPMDLEIGPDGALYLLEWGTQYNGNNTDAQIARIEYAVDGFETLHARN